MAKNWCKIISLPEHDVLVERLSNDEDGEHISIKISFPTMVAKLTPSFGEDKEAADKHFEEFNEVAAQECLDFFKENVMPDVDNLELQRTRKNRHNG